MDNDPLLIVRRVLPVDVRGVVGLLVERHGRRGSSADETDIHKVVLAALEHPGVLIAGAYHEGQPGFAHGKLVGLVTMQTLVSIEDLGEVGWIETLYVRPQYRRRGLARRLLEQALAWGEARGLRSIDVEFSEQHDTEAADRLYRNHGFELIRRSRMTRKLA
jgi:ribosomal protein S18 acetylase RimI-like enzyme